MGDSPTLPVLPLDDTTNVELTVEEFNQLQKDYNSYVKINPNISREDQLDYLKGLFAPYII